MAKFKCEEKAILISSNSEVQIKKVIQDYGAKSVKYELYSGEKVSESELKKKDLAEEFDKFNKSVEKLDNKKTEKNKSKKDGVSVVEKSDKVINNQEVEKIDENEQND